MLVHHDCANGVNLFKKKIVGDKEDNFLLE